MQATGKADSTDSSVTKMCLRNLNSKKFTTPKLLGLFTFILTTGLMLTTGSVRAEPHTMLAADSELENTERNVRDQGDTKKLTPENQKATRSDRQITAAIRRAVVKDKSLSRNAHNAKIITREGNVTLRGPVKNSEEKTKLQSIAQKTRGVKQVDNQLEAEAP
jgi:osmotically-inducible protein OsmY